MRSRRSTHALLGWAAAFLVGAVAPLGASAQSNQVKLLSRTFVPKPGTAPALREALKGATRPTLHAILQFKKPLTVEQHALLREKGVLLQGHLGGNAYSAAVPKGLDLDQASLRGLLRAADTLAPTDKLKRAVARRSFEKWAVDDSTNRVKLLVQFHQDVSAAHVAEDLQKVGATGKRYGADNSWATTLAPADIAKLAELDSVRSVDQGPIPFLPLNDGGRRWAESDEAQQSRFGNPQPAFGKVSGLGIHAGICDTGIDAAHNDFNEVTVAGGSGATRVYHPRNGYGGHGTHVASITGGSGLNSAANGVPAFSLRGQAPRCSLGDYPGFGGDAQSFHDAIVTDHTEVTNHSYVQSMTIYDAVAASIDRIVRGDGVDGSGNPIPARPQVWAAGNNGTAAQYGNEEGYYAVFTSAKNSISVGSLDAMDGRLSDYSSLGPTFDGRIKPDVAAPGCFDSIASPSVGILAAQGGSQGYTTMCGTSMAAPVVTGVVAGIMEQMQTTYGTLPAHPSTYKALLVATAKDHVKLRTHPDREFNNPDTTTPVLNHAGPDFATGFGLVDADAARSLASKSNHWRESSIAATGSTKSWCVYVKPGADMLKVAIAWDDEPGDTTTAETATKLVNDLDLTLAAPDASKVLPWTLDPLPLTTTPGDGAADPIAAADVKPAYRGADHRNNVEVASVPLPAAGWWRISVRGFSLPTGNTQPFSLVSTQPISALCPLPPPSFCKLHPWACIDICKIKPWVCKGVQEWDPFRVHGKDWHVNPGAVIPVDEICKYAINCPGCQGGAGSYCPGWRIDVGGMPADAVVQIMDRAGKVIAEEKGPGAQRSLRVARRLAGDDEPYVVITDPQGRPYEQKLKLNFDVKKL